jgi:hypothetical protein
MHLLVPRACHARALAHLARQDLAKRAALQPVLASEGAHMMWVYNAGLYGLDIEHATNLEAAQGDLDPGTGNLFATAK